jgi:hypothetical protein
LDKKMIGRNREEILEGSLDKNLAKRRIEELLR